MFDDLYRGRRVVITGHTGFKGSWLTLWLRKLGAEVCGIALPMNEPCHYNLLKPQIRSEYLDIRDLDALKNIFADFQPEAVFHLAAQPLVRRSYLEPVETFAVNVLGTVNVLEACRLTPSVRAIVAVTSDKCYENRERDRGYREDEPMGGHDPYSASKGCAELVASGYRRSFFSVPGAPLLATGRAGNVIGGGDWAEDRLVPDLMRAAAAGRPAELRNPGSVRPWQHVLEPLSGYLALGAKLLSGCREFASAWNFGPAEAEAVTVGAAAAALAGHWDRIRIVSANTPALGPHEAGLLRLNCDKAAEQLGWHGVWSLQETFERTAAWYREFHTSGRVNTLEDLERYTADAVERKLPWTK